MNLLINGESYQISNTASPVVADALALFINEQQAKLSYAVALNGTFVSKQTYSSTSVKENDALDVLFPIVGG